MRITNEELEEFKKTYAETGSPTDDFDKWFDEFISQENEYIPEDKNDWRFGDFLDVKNDLDLHNYVIMVNCFGLDQRKYHKTLCVIDFSYFVEKKEDLFEIVKIVRDLTDKHFIRFCIFKKREDEIYYDNQSHVNIRSSEEFKDLIKKEDIESKTIKQRLEDHIYKWLTNEINAEEKVDDSRMPDFLDFTSEKIKMMVKDKLKKNFT